MFGSVRNTCGEFDVDMVLDKIGIGKVIGRDASGSVSEGGDG